MAKNLKKNLEKIFRDANSSEALFDGFQIIIVSKIKDPVLFKTLLANPCLTEDEIMFFAEKLALEFRECAYTIFLWTGTIFETKFGCVDHSFNYYAKAINMKPFKYEPFLSMIHLYDYEMDIPTNRAIMEFIDGLIEFVEEKSKVYFALANHYIKTGEIEYMKKYQALAEKAQKDELDNNFNSN